ncbi:2-C-methyl-D-erythritol 2,4-cyclodiphosphate synthase [Candidatus Riesia pediculischaeffi]|uniref:2-C-methyl-D-erythritol 2,4-cyclodiphosphate synthase n=1 Tax=Candidatus Riesia pediculischaeffi PTSU TaxID=1401651 RepID=A0A0C1S164_9ENTR|nr:2-C-methyl-D-erythritol 2,4-cyclodiphosphate synthase [Candidatus Riesia pediculischaeffi]KIE64282.1 2-C-methyl-D-erythritol 2,4-cyclodiphosphate synthase [Candidatus Riesia pediculischaeffi PTSU]
MRIGHGFDVHRFEGDGPILLGGVSLPCLKGVSSHSDGDILLHAVIDSILGAAGMGDIGVYFSDDDARFKGISSRVLLRRIWKKVRRMYKIGNIDVTIIADFPRIRMHTERMKENISLDLSCSVDDINIKSTTTENIGFFKKEMGIACEAVVLLEKL